MQIEQFQPPERGIPHPYIGADSAGELFEHDPLTAPRRQPVRRSSPAPTRALRATANDGIHPVVLALAVLVLVAALIWAIGIGIGIGGPSTPQAPVVDAGGVQ